MTDTKKKTNLLFLLFPLLYAGIGFLIIRFMLAGGRWPYGDDVMYHIYRGEKVLKALQNGHLWVNLDLQWYNGVEILRYWSPLPAYLMAFCDWAAGGSMSGYLLFTWLLYVISAMSWYLIGLHMGRPLLGSLLGMIWFFLPQNVLYYYVYGNLAGMCGIACVLPWMISFLQDYLDYPGKANLWKLALSSALMGFCHSGFALLALLVLVIWLAFQKLSDHELKNGWSAILVMVLGFLLTGCWFLASRRGVSPVDYSQQLKIAFQSLGTTLNPFDRLRTNFRNYYFGLSVFVISIIGCFAAEKKARAGFLCTCVICLLTSKAAYEVIRVIPGGSFLWTSRMISITTALFFFSLLEWRTLKKKLQIPAVVLLVLDFLPSGLVIYGNGNHAGLTERFNEEQSGTLLKEAKSLARQRIALIDASSLDSIGAYLTSSWKGENNSAYGAGYEAAVTRKNITMLNRSANDGYYDYLFDRAEELGCDIVDVQIAQLENGPTDIEKTTSSAARRGYSLVDQNSEYLLYQLDVKGTFGTVDHYKGIVIGKNAADTAETFPALKEADETDLSRYTYDQLKDYDLIYLNGFAMSDREKAEKLIERLSDHGVRIVVAADGIPEDKASRNQTFLGVTCSPISFRNGYPELHTDTGKLDLMLFPKEAENWHTVYLNGLEDVTGSITDNGLKLAFAGHVKNDNITFIGLNLTYFYALTRDPQAEQFLSQCMGIKSDELPERTIVNVKIREKADGLQVETDRNAVNTTLSYHDIFTSDEAVWSEDNLLHVDKGTTVIHYRHPYVLGGCLITLGALAVLTGMAFRQNHSRKKKNDYNEAE